MSLEERMVVEERVIKEERIVIRRENSLVEKVIRRKNSRGGKLHQKREWSWSVEYTIKLHSWQCIWMLCTLNYIYFVMKCGMIAALSRVYMVGNILATSYETEQSVWMVSWVPNTAIQAKRQLGKASLRRTIVLHNVWFLICASRSSNMSC